MKFLEKIKTFFLNLFTKAKKDAIDTAKDVEEKAKEEADKAAKKAKSAVEKAEEDFKKYVKGPQFAKWTWLFAVGFFLYMGIEVLFTGIVSNFTQGPLLRFMGHSSLWMGVIGGIMLISLGALNGIKWIKKQSLFIQSLIGAAIITLTEFISGCVLNLWLGLNIWDYSKIWFNVYGQINLLYSVFWFFLSPLAFWADDNLRWVLYKTGICAEMEAPYDLCWFYKQLFTFKPITYPLTTAAKK